MRFITYTLETFNAKGIGQTNLVARYKVVQEYPDGTSIKKIALKIIKGDLKNGWPKEVGFYRFEAAERSCIIQKKDIKNGRTSKHKKDR